MATAKHLQRYGPEKGFNARKNVFSIKVGDAIIVDIYPGQAFWPAFKSLNKAEKAVSKCISSIPISYQEAKKIRRILQMMGQKQDEGRYKFKGPGDMSMRHHAVGGRGPRLFLNKCKIPFAAYSLFNRPVSRIF